MCIKMDFIMLINHSSEMLKSLEFRIGLQMQHRRRIAISGTTCRGPSEFREPVGPVAQRSPVVRSYRRSH
jgi:hypothetical protein